MNSIKKGLIGLICWLLSFLPFRSIGFLGGYLGLIIMKLSKRSGARLRNNLLLTKLANDDNIDEIAKEAAKNFGKTILESLIIWHRSKKYSAKLVLENIGLDQVKKEVANGPVLFLTPHIGNFEIAVKSTAYAIDSKKFNILYKPSKDKLFNQIMVEGRAEDNIKPVPTNRHGVLSLIRAIKKDQLLGILPDSVASSGDGVWVKFFGVPVFATTLAAKFSLMPNVKTFIVTSTRVKSGFINEFIPYTPPSIEIPEVVQDLYKLFEKIVANNLVQYYWSYDRFRIPSSQKFGK